MEDLKCTWGVCRDDVYEYVTDEFCALPQLLEQIAHLRDLLTRIQGLTPS